MTPLPRKDPRERRAGRLASRRRGDPRRDAPSRLAPARGFLLAVLVVLATSCRRDPPTDAIERVRAARSGGTWCVDLDGGNLARRWAEHHAARLSEPASFVTAQVPADDRPLMVFTRTVPQPFPLALSEPFEEWMGRVEPAFSDLDAARAALWMHGFAGARRVSILVAPDPALVPWELLRPPVALEESFLCVRDGVLHTRGSLVAEPGGYRPRFDLESFPHEARRAFQRDAIPGEGLPRVRHAPGLTRAAVDAALDRWRSVEAPLGGRAFAGTDLWLHGDPRAMRSITGLAAWEHLDGGGRVVHWLVPPDGRWHRHGAALVEAHLRRRWGDELPTWWFEGAAVWLTGNGPRRLETLGRAPALEPDDLARWLVLPERWAARPRNERHAAAALAWSVLSHGLPRPEDAASAWKRLAARAEGLAPAIAGPLRALRRAEEAVRPLQGAFVRGVAIAEGFSDGWVGSGFERALDRAQALGANRIVLTWAEPPVLIGATEPEFPWEWAVARIHARGLGVRLRLRPALVSSARFLGQFRHPHAEPRAASFDRLGGWLVAAAHRAHVLGVDELEIGPGLEATLGLEPDERERPAEAWGPILAGVRAAAGLPVVFALADAPHVTACRELLTEVSAVAVTHRGAQREGIWGERSTERSVGVRNYERRMRDRAWQFLESLRSVVEEGSTRRLELHVRVHAHAFANEDPDRPREGGDDRERQFVVLQALLHAATDHPTTAGVVLEGGEVAALPGAAVSGFATTALEEEIRARFRRVTGFERDWMERALGGLRSSWMPFPRR